MNHAKYRPFPAFEGVSFKREWPDKIITKAPIWCSVDLRDGNQALVTPMTLSRKLAFFKLLTKIGFKEIETSFPAASDTEFLFTRELIEKELIPDDVTIQVLTQAREHIIDKTFDSLRGIDKAIVHIYNSVSRLQRDVVFGLDVNGVKNIATEGVKRCLDDADKFGLEKFRFEYSPESFTQTELPVAAEICQAVLDILLPAVKGEVIINLPATVESSTPNVYADQIEYMSRNLTPRDRVVLSLHAHNDRGCGVAATELAILAGADRVEGTLFGNGERTGNADVVTLAMNLFSQGIGSGLDFSDIDEIASFYEESTGLSVSKRHPYAGELVFTAFSGSHQDAIKKGMAKKAADIWEVPYLPIDPADVGRSYDPIIRINSQSGKGGVAFVLERGFGLSLPKPLAAEFSALVTKVSDEGAKELSPDEIYKLFINEYADKNKPAALITFNEQTGDGDTTKVDAKIEVDDKVREISGEGGGLVEAFINALSREFGKSYEVTDYRQDAMEQGSKSRAVTYVAIETNGKTYRGAGISSSTSKSSLKAILSALNRI